MSDVLFIQLPIQRYMQKGFQVQNEFNPALGLMSLATVLEFNGRTSKIIDLFTEPMGKEEFLNIIRLEEPSLIGISVYSENIDIGIGFSKLIRENFPNVKIFMGGPHVSLDDKEFKENDCIDFIIQNEGEGAIVEVVEAVLSHETIISFCDIPGVQYRKDGIVFVNSRRKFICDLDLLPIIKREYFPLEKYQKNLFINVSTSRGCPSKCIYCAATALSGGRYRVRSIDHVFLEIVMLQDTIACVCFTIVDDSFTILKDRLKRFLTLIKENGKQFKWNCESRINGMTKEILQDMLEANCVAIQYGIESGNQEVLNKIQKHIELKEALNVIDTTLMVGILVTVGFIIGHYCDTNETMRETIDLLLGLKKKYGRKLVIGLSYNTPFPGTYQYLHREELGLKMDSMDLRKFNMVEPIAYTDQFTIEDQRNYMYEVKDSLVDVRELMVMFE